MRKILRTIVQWLQCLAHGPHGVVCLGLGHALHLLHSLGHRQSPGWAYLGLALLAASLAEIVNALLQLMERRRH